MLLVRVHSLGLDTTSDQPVILLKEEDGLRILPIWIGHPEATAILIAIERVEPPRPMTHDLMLSVLVASGLKLERVEITRLEAGTFFATLVLRGEDSTVVIDARPSDSIALAVRAACPILVAEEIMNQAGIVPDDEAEEEVERFRDFLESVDPEDFESS